MSKFFALLYGIVCYLFFFVTFLYAIGFVGNLIVPKNIDSGTPGPIGAAIIVNLILLSLFAVQHSVMARPGFKEWWTRFVSPPIERSTFVLFTCVVFYLLFTLWRPMPSAVWTVEHSGGRMVLQLLMWAGFGMVLISSFLIDHFDLFGLRQVWLNFQGTPYTHHPFKTTAFYNIIRHPLMLGFIIAFWATPDMTVGHLFFAVVTTVYILIAIQIEERDLVELLGEPYRAYKLRVPMLIPMPGKSAGGSKAADGG